MKLTEDRVLAYGWVLLVSGGGLACWLLAAASGMPYLLQLLSFLAGSCIVGGAGLFVPAVLARFRRPPTSPRARTDDAV